MSPSGEIVRREFNTVSRLSTTGGFLSPTARFTDEEIETVVNRFVATVETWADEFDHTVWFDREIEDGTLERVFIDIDESSATGWITVINDPPHPQEVRVELDRNPHSLAATDHEALKTRLQAVSIRDVVSNHAALNTDDSD